MLSMRGFTKKFSVTVACIGVVSLVSACSLFDGLDRQQAKEYHKCRANCIEYCNEQIHDQEGYGMCGGQQRPAPASSDMPLRPDMDLAPMGGLSFKPLFDGYVANEEQRFRRLEHAVQQIRNEVDVLAPKVVEVADKQEVSQSSTMPMSLQPGARGLTAVPPEPMEEAVYQPALPVASASVNSIRMADHKDKTRIVLDVTKDIPLPVSIANQGKTLVVDLANAGWNTRPVWLATKGALVSGYRVEGKMLYVDLMYASRVAKQLMLKPESKVSSHYRLVLDLVSDVVHK